MNRIFATAIVSICMSAMAQFALQRGMRAASGTALSAGEWGLSEAMALITNPFLILGAVLYGLGALIWLGVLAHWDVSKAYPLVGLGFALTTVVGFLLGEAVTPARIAGVAAICVGVYLIASS